ncbi:MAG: hypothetical protein J6S85_24765 [Methanobrevibacter sp.]|nr:hypothetical protein [Methanobrevibacter sp.]
MLANTETSLIGGVIGTSISAVGTATQTNEVLQTISLIITIVGALISMVIIPVLNWYMKSKKDGKIDKDELKEGIDILSQGTQNFIDEVNKGKGEEDNANNPRKDGSN